MSIRQKGVLEIEGNIKMLQTLPSLRWVKSDEKPTAYSPTPFFRHLHSFFVTSYIIPYFSLFSLWSNQRENSSRKRKQQFFPLFYFISAIFKGSGSSGGASINWKVLLGTFMRVPWRLSKKNPNNGGIRTFFLHKEGGKMPCSLCVGYWEMLRAGKPTIQPS